MDPLSRDPFPCGELDPADLDALEDLTDDEVLALFDPEDDPDEYEPPPARLVVDVAIPIDNYPPA